MRVRFVIMKVVGALSTLAFVVVFNFFLFRVVNDNTVESMFRGRNLSDSQIARLERQFNLDGSKWDQFTAYVGQLLRGSVKPAGARRTRSSCRSRLLGFMNRSALSNKRRAVYKQAEQQ